jgi:hypothetical protein
MQPHMLPRTGFVKLDNAAGRRPRSVTGLPMLRNPTVEPPTARYNLTLDPHANRLYPPLDPPLTLHGKFKQIDEAYLVDSYARQGIDKYIELCVKQGWRLECKSPEPIEYLEQRFEIMSIMLDLPFSILITHLVNDYIKYSNAFWIKRRGVLPVDVPGIPKQGVFGASAPVLGYFRVDPKRIFQVRSKDGKQIVGWEYKPENGKGFTIARRDLIHFAHNVQPGHFLGSPSLEPVLEDIRAYRQCEEYVIKLLYKHLTPLLHHEVPDLTGTGMGRQEDVDAASATHSLIAPDGLIVTPPGHKINYIGVESHSLRGEGYLKLIRERVYSGMGVNPIVMGEGETTTAGSADAMTIMMHNRAKHYQAQLAAQITQHVIFELLLEGGFDPTLRPDKVRWSFNEIEIEALLARENHEIQKFTNGITNEDECRRALGMEPMSDEEYERTHVFRVQIPLAKAQAEARNPFGAPDGPSNQVANRARPANQHGTRPAPKVRPNR